MEGDGAPWLEVGDGPAPAEVALRVAWWAAQEDRAVAALGAGALATPVGHPTGPGPPGQAAPALADHLPGEVLARDLTALVEAWLGPGLDALGPGGRRPLQRGPLARAGGWDDLRRDVPWVRAWGRPSALVAAVGRDARVATHLVFALAAPPALGSTLGRYAERVADLAARLAGRPAVRAWDVGCGTGEGTWELAAALGQSRSGAAGAGPSVHVVGTSPCPFERRMAARRDRPHDPARAAPLRALGVPDGCAVRFVAGDARREAPGGAFDLVTCHGLLGEGARGPAIAEVVATVAAALAPGGLLSVADRFRQDRARAAATATAAAARAVGLRALAPGLFLR